MTVYISFTHAAQPHSSLHKGAVQNSPICTGHHTFWRLTFKSSFRRNLWTSRASVAQLVRARDS